MKTTPVGKKEVVYRGKIIEVVRQRMRVGDKEEVFEIARRSPGVRLIIVSPKRKLLLTREHRIEHDKIDFRLPGGKVFDSLDDYSRALAKDQSLLEYAREAARREAAEEAGITVDELEYFTTSKAGATVEWDLYYFVVTRFQHHKQRLDPGENIEVSWINLEKAKEICLSGQMQEDRSAAVLLRFLHSITRRATQAD